MILLGIILFVISIGDQSVSARSLLANSYWDVYHPYNEIMAFVDGKAAECGERCQILSLGDSRHGRPLKFIKISSTNATESDKPRIWIDGGIHAREWVAHATATYFIERLIDDFETDETVQKILEAFDWYILPVLNPDGYVYSWEHNRLWRKSRAFYDNSTCVGVDVNRNYDYKWMTIGASDDPCDETFAGFHAFSEPEALQHANYMMQHKEDWEIFITIHSYGQLWMAPYGYTKELPEDYDELMRAGRIAISALTAVHGTEYKLGTASEILYQSSGTSRDWAAGALNVPYVYTLELRDQGAEGFVLPSDQILPTCQETWAGVQALANYVAEK